MRTGRVALAIAVTTAALLVPGATAQDVAPPAGPPPVAAAPADPAAAERDAARSLAAKQDFAGAIQALREARKKHGATAGVLRDEGRI